MHVLSHKANKFISMDRTFEFRDAITGQDHKNYAGSTLLKKKGRKVTSPFVLKSGEIFVEILTFEGLLKSVFAEFVGYHVNYVSQTGESDAKMSESDRDDLSQEVTSFIAAVGAELKEMKEMVSRLGCNSTADDNGLYNTTNIASKSHYQEILAFLTARLVRVFSDHQMSYLYTMTIMHNME